jgi:hypothetical protein
MFFYKDFHTVFMVILQCIKDLLHSKKMFTCSGNNAPISRLFLKWKWTK